MLAILADPDDHRTPALLRDGLLTVAVLLRSVEQKLEGIDKQLVAASRDNATCRPLITAPGYGPMLSSAMAAFVTNPAAFRSGGDFAASLGLVPRQDGTGGKIGSGRSANAATATCADCWSTVPLRC